MARLAPNTPSLVQQIAENGPKAETVAQEINALKENDVARREVVAELEASVRRMHAFLLKTDSHLSSWGKDMWTEKIANCGKAIVELDPDGEK